MPPPALHAQQHARVCVYVCVRLAVAAAATAVTAAAAAAAAAALAAAANNSRSSGAAASPNPPLFFLSLSGFWERAWKTKKKRKLMKRGLVARSFTHTRTRPHLIFSASPSLKGSTKKTPQVGRQHQPVLRTMFLRLCALPTPAPQIHRSMRFLMNDPFIPSTAHTYIPERTPLAFSPAPFTPPPHTTHTRPHAHHHRHALALFTAACPTHHTTGPP